MLTGRCCSCEKDIGVDEDFEFFSHLLFRNRRRFLSHNERVLPATPRANHRCWRQFPEVNALSQQPARAPSVSSESGRRYHLIHQMIGVTRLDIIFFANFGWEGQRTSLAKLNCCAHGASPFFVLSEILHIQYIRALLPMQKIAVLWLLSSPRPHQNSFPTIRPVSRPPASPGPARCACRGRGGD